MLTILFLGFLIGMQHALEADHIAAVSSVAARQTSLGGVVRHGVAWGAGHSPTLLIFAGATILLDVTASESLAALLELCVGVMLVLLGGHVLARLIRDRIHFHSHGHGDADPPGRLGDPEPAAGALLRGPVGPRLDPRHGDLLSAVMRSTMPAWPACWAHDRCASTLRRPEPKKGDRLFFQKSSLSPFLVRVRRLSMTTLAP